MLSTLGGQIGGPGNLGVPRETSRKDEGIDSNSERTGGSYGVHHPARVYG